MAGAADCGEEGLQLANEGGESGEIDLLLPVAHGFGGVGMHLDNEAVGTHCNGSAAKRDDEIGASTALAWIDDDGEVAFFFCDGDGCEIEGVAGVGFKGADAAFAEKDIGIAVGEEVFGGQEPFLDAFAHSAFEQDGFATAGTGNEKLEVLGVAGTDLQEVGDFGDGIDIVLAEDFGDNFEACFPAGLVEEAQAFLAEALEFVGGGAGFVGTAAQNGGTGLADRVRGFQELTFAFNRAGAGHEGEARAADGDAADRHHAVVGMGFATHQFVTFLDTENAFDLGQHVKGLEIGVGGFIADGGNDGLVRAVNGSGRVAQDLDFGEDLFDFRRRGMRAQNNDHGKKLRRDRQWGQKIKDRLRGAQRVGVFAYPATCVAHGFADFFDGVAGAGNHSSDCAVEHRQVVVVVADGQDRGAGDCRGAGELAQGGAFAVIAVAEAHVNGVALEIEIGMFLGEGAQEVNQFFHGRLVAGDDADGEFGVLNNLKTQAAGGVLEDLPEGGSGEAAEAVMFQIAAVVPVPERHPAARSVFKNVAFVDNREIWRMRRGEFHEPLVEIFQTPSGVDHPGGSGGF